MTTEATYAKPMGILDYTAVTAVEAGTIVLLASGRAGIVQTDLAAGELGSVQDTGIINATVDTNVVWSDGEEIWWDDANNTAVVAGAATATFRLGLAIGAKVAGVLIGQVELNGRPGPMKLVTVADSVALTASAAETILATYSIPANSLKQGQVLAFIAALIATATNATDTFQFRVRLGGLTGTVVADTTAIDLANNDVGVIRGEVVIREDGAVGAFVAESLSMLKTTPTPSLVQSTAIDTTAATTLVLTGQHSTTSAGNISKATIFAVEKK